MVRNILRTISFIDHWELLLEHNIATSLVPHCSFQTHSVERLVGMYGNSNVTMGINESEEYGENQ